MSSFPWTMATEREYSNKPWSDECQGIACDGRHWYLASNRSKRHSVYKFGLDMKLIKEFRIGESYGRHAGALDYYKGCVYVPMEPSCTVLRIGDDLTTVEAFPLQGQAGGAPPQTHMPWCAMNPHDGLLYSSDFDDVTLIHRYDPANGFRQKGSLVLDLPVDRVQGGCFSRSGRLYLTSDASVDVKGFEPDGRYIGSAAVNLNNSAGEEVEGLCFYPIDVEGHATQVHVILLDNDLLSSDDTIIKHYAAASPGEL